MTYRRKEQIGNCTLYLGDCLEVLPTLDEIDALITDPPYSSGGQFRSDRAASTTTKYVNSDTKAYRPEFSGDNRDQRAFLTWSSIWLGQALSRSNTGAVVMMFSDWRQVPTMSDALQCGGWIWRNLVTWWKPGIRMQKGRFSASSEYILYGSNGVPAEGEKSPQNVLRFAPSSTAEREHIAEKPITLMQELVGVTVPGGIVVDPFMGSGTTGVACAKMGRSFIGIEIDEGYFDIACERIRAAYAQPDMFVEVTS